MARARVVAPAGAAGSPRCPRRGISDEAGLDDARAPDTRSGAAAPAHTAKEPHMLDPKEQAKGGFRAHAEREQERRDKLAEARREADAAAGLVAGAPTAAEGQPDAARSPDGRDADGERSPYADGEPGPNAPSAGRRPKRWH